MTGAVPSAGDLVVAGLADSVDDNIEDVAGGLVEDVTASEEPDAGALPGELPVDAALGLVTALLICSVMPAGACSAASGWAESW